MIEDVIFRALKVCVDELRATDFGLRSHAFPTEDHLDECVRAAVELAREPRCSGARFIIGSSKRPGVELPPQVIVLEPHAAAAEATRLRNARAEEGETIGFLVYLNTDSTPGEAGLNVLTEVTPEKVAEAYAASAGWQMLADLASRRARLVRTRVADTSVTTLARYAELARSTSEARALPLLGLVPARQPKALPGPTPARELDLLRGVKAAGAIKRVMQRLSALSGEETAAVERTLAGALLPDVDDPIKEAARLAHAAYKFATGVSEDAGELCGITVEFARLLRAGERALALPADEGEEPGGDEGEEPRSEGYTDEALLDDLPDAFQSGRVAGELGEADDDDPTFSVETDGGVSVVLRPATPRGLLRALLSSKDPELLIRQVRFGDCIEVSDTAQLRATRRIPTAKLRGRDSGIETEAAHLAALRNPIDRFLAARADLVSATIGMMQSEPDATLGEGESGPEAGVMLALALLDAHPLVVVGRLPDRASAYVDAYQSLINAVYPSGAPSQRVVEWLANLDLAFAAEGATATAARLLPLHPFRVVRALLWLKNGVEPPAMPPRLALVYDHPQTLLPDNIADVYALSTRAWPSARGVALAVRQGLGALWAMLAPRRLASSVSVELVDLPDATAAIDALCVEARRRFEDDADVGEGLHLEVRATFTDAKRAEAWRRPDPADLSVTAREALEATRGDGVSLGLPRRATELADDELCHLAIHAVDTPYARLAEDTGGRGGGLPLSYVPGPNGNVAAICVRGVSSLDSYDALLDGLDLARKPTGLDPSTRPADIGGAIVRALVARGGWPVKPTADTSLVSYGEVDGHVAAVICDGGALRRDLGAALERVTTSAKGLNVERMRAAVLSLYSCRSLLADLLEGLDERHLRGQIALTRAFVEARAGDANPTLPLSLDCPEGHRWARAVQRHFNVDRSRADLVLVEAADRDRAALGPLRVVELKARQKNATFATPAAREHLSTQARVAAARVRACFAAPANAEPKTALQRVAWMEASRQRLASEWRAVLTDFDRRLQERECPPLVVECWIVPEAPWTEDTRFEESHPMLDVQGEPVPGEAVLVRFFIMPPLDLGGPTPRVRRKPQGAGPSQGPAEPRAVASGGVTRTQPPTTTAPLASTAARAVDPPLPAAAPTAAPSAANTPPVQDGTPPAQPKPGASRRSDEGIVVRIGDVLQPGAMTPAIWTPNRVDRVNHYNVGITGTMGTGKTQLTKSLIAQLVGQAEFNPGGKPPGVLVFDYKGDYGLNTRDDFPRRIGATVLPPEGLPLNPLRPSAPQNRQDLTRMVYSFADTLLAIEPRIGRVQRDQIVKGVQACLADAGIDAADPKTFTRPFPTIKDLLDLLTKRDLAAGSPQSLLSELVDLGVFAEEAPEADIGALFDGINVIDLQPLAGMRPTIRAIIAFFMNAFYRQMLQGAEAPLAPGEAPGKELRQLRRMILVDEADDFLSLNIESLRYILQQGRSFGCGVILSTQFLSHFDQGGEELKASIGTWILHQMANVDRKSLSSLFSLNTRDEAVNIAAKIGALPKHTSLCRGLSTEGCRDRLVTVRDLAFKDLIAT
ncbi:MAG: hypothetical protein JWM10_726 [Myxococcaceae bacterium]|nr:hypothetical protein [Myxococcaceae bacterium]